MRTGDSRGAMASIDAGAHEVLALLNGEGVNLAGLNSPRQTVVSGDASAIDNVLARAREKGLSSMNLPVSHAFHSAAMAPAAPLLAAHLSNEEFQAVQRPVVSTISGENSGPILIYRSCFAGN